MAETIQGGLHHDMCRIIQRSGRLSLSILGRASTRERIDVQATGHDATTDGDADAKTEKNVAEMHHGGAGG